MRTPTRQALAVVFALSLAFAACSSDDKGGAGLGTAGESAASETAPTGTGAMPTTPAAVDTSYDGGEVAVRVVNLLDDEVDVYVRTSGLVQAYLVAPGLAPGEVSEFYNPPADGELVVTTAGAGEADCVIDCPHFLASVSTYADYGPVHTLILANDEGVPSSLDLWEQPTVTNGNANEMVPADPTAGIVVVTGYAVDDADFGLRMAVVGTSGCVEPFNLSGVLIGGNQTPAFLLPSASVEVTIHDNNDRDCTGTPVGGPFALEVGAGERAHVILHGSIADGVEAIILPMD